MDLQLDQNFEFLAMSLEQLLRLAAYGFTASALETGRRWIMTKPRTEAQLRAQRARSNLDTPKGRVIFILAGGPAAVLATVMTHQMVIIVAFAAYWPDMLDMFAQARAAHTSAGQQSPPISSGREG